MQRVGILAPAFRRSALLWRLQIEDSGVWEDQQAKGQSANRMLATKLHIKKRSRYAEENSPVSAVISPLPVDLEWALHGNGSGIPEPKFRALKDEGR